jgi:hypothetical protein
LDKALEWLLNNKDWIFSGVVIAFAGGVIIFIVSSIKKKKTSQEFGRRRGTR